MDQVLKGEIVSAMQGVCDVSDGPRGLSFSRLPRWTYPQHSHAPMVAKMAERLSGSHLRIETAATEITVVYRSNRDSNPTFNWMAGPSTITMTTDGFEASVSHSDGDVTVWENDEVKEVIEGVDSIAQFVLPASDQPRAVEIWFPHNCKIELIDLQTNLPWSPADKSGHRLWVHYGSSISHCEDAASPIGVWPVAAARQLGFDIFNLGLSGNAHLDQFAARTIRDLPADLISLKLGINVVNGAAMTMRTFVSAFHGFLDTIREGKPDTPILVISPVSCPAHEQNPGPSAMDSNGQVIGQEPSEHSWIGELTLSRIRSQLAAAVADRSENDPNLYYLDGLELMNHDEALAMPDGLHPDATGYLQIADHFVRRHPRSWSGLNH